LSKLQRRIDAKFSPHSSLVDDATVTIHCDLEPDQRSMKNVVGLLEPAEGHTTTGGASTVVKDTIVVGAHYDHVGLGNFGSLGGKGNIHNGADDNASGTTALLEIAEYLASRRHELRRRVLFIAFSGEELGLLGSKHYVREPRVPLADCHAMLNLDMIGRAQKNRLYVGGTGTSPIWPEMLRRLNKQTSRFDLTLWPGGKAPSDHSSFYEANMPVLFFFTGLHGDYHRPSDDPRTLNYAGHEKVARLAAAVTFELATRAGDKPQFTRCDAGGFSVGPFTGLSVEQRDDGVYVAYVEKRSPASKARFKVGDRIVTWGGADLPTTNRYNDLVSKAKPGDKVDVVIEREGKRKTLKLKLGKT
nr:M28 family peptidase [Planctomycetota bacterium]